MVEDQIYIWVKEVGGLLLSSLLSKIYTGRNSFGIDDR